MALHVKKVKQNRRFQHVVNEIEASILAGEIRPGEQLPPEHELKIMFGTGRGTVREALRVLEEKGLVVIRAGANGGAFVKAADPAKLTEHLDLLVQAQSIAPEHIKEFREAIEPMAASLAAGRVTTAGAARLRSAFTIAEKGFADHDPEMFMQGDVAVHVAIAELTGNPLLTAVLRMVHEHVLGTSADYALEGDKTLKDNLEDLRGLVSAVADGHAEDAGWRAMDHVRKFHGCMKAAKGETR
ncbi:FCD domain-containing protein [Pseudodesulfovibrio sp.]|nr:FCD domain-containing protein [Pseudodesulfovibrio sp.]